MKARIYISFVILVSTFSLLASAATDVKLGLNWKAESEFGGFYAAQIKEFYKKHSLNVNIQEGGAGTPTVQMLAAGTIDFGIVSADELVIARSQKQPLVAVYAAFQKSPYMIMAHQSKGFKTLSDLFKSNITLSIIRGLPFANYLEKKYGFKNIKVVPYTGGVTSFLSDENFAQQGFISSEPLLALKKGVKTSTFMVSEEGFNPYVVVMAVHEKTIKEKPELVKSMVAAVREGWIEYLKNPKTTQEHIAKLNPTMDVKTQSEMFDIEKTLVDMDKKSKSALGSMSDERWQTLIDQLAELKLIKNKPKASEVFQNL